MVYGQEVVMPMEYIVPILRIATITNMAEQDIMEERLSQLVTLEEDRFIVGFHQQVQKAHKKACYDRHIRQKVFKEEDLVFLYDNNFVRHPG